MWGWGTAFVVTLDANSVLIPRRKHYVVKGVVCRGKNGVCKKLELSRHKCLGRGSRSVGLGP